MKRSAFFISGIFILSIVSGVLLSRASLVGKSGMTLFYTEYNFLKTWWKGALLIFIILFLIYLIQGMLQKQKPPGQKKMINYIAIFLATAGWYFTYLDFNNTVSHRFLGTAFHIGGYLFWIGWIAISIKYLLDTRLHAQIDNRHEIHR